MTPEQAVKYIILETQYRWDGKEIPINLTGMEVDELYDQESCLWDAKSETREGEVETNIPSDYSRHYESKSVAAKAPNGQWVGWTYWYGGGKHGCPEEIDWMEYAYFLDCVEEQKVVTVRTFSKVEGC
jgi:hypothetical protein